MIKANLKESKLCIGYNYFNEMHYAVYMDFPPSESVFQYFENIVYDNMSEICDVHLVSEDGEIYPISSIMLPCLSDSVENLTFCLVVKSENLNNLKFIEQLFGKHLSSMSHLNKCLLSDGVCDEKDNQKEEEKV